MGKIRLHRPVQYFTGVLLSRSLDWAPVRAAVEREFGPIETESPPHPFTTTRYYCVEMGDLIDRRFVLFAGLGAPEDLAGWKVRANVLEEELARLVGGDRPRPVNLDPGYLELAKVVLASTKNFYHRVALRDGIFAEVTLHYRDKAWQTFPWTFPDFAGGAYHAFFLEARARYQAKLTAGG